MKQNHLKIFVLALLCMACPLTFSSAETPSPEPDEPDGRYCGFVYNAGYLVRFEIVLGKTEDGRLIGTMTYRDGDDVTKGTVEELVKKQGRERSVEWKDKYGSGLAIWKFDEKFDEFDGLWGTGMNIPQYTWTGKRCNDVTS
ncbi:hypothetical protein [uncultured Bartonella sp.]|uniref:hypothetical protein n=1 Tax=uncultured Bartonella sp. TaxID=104108 RepID=UPI0025DAB862|nr:hypothetical protein [uncultured Bartonella sp.]